MQIYTTIPQLSLLFLEYFPCVVFSLVILYVQAIYIHSFLPTCKAYYLIQTCIQVDAVNLSIYISFVVLIVVDTQDKPKYNVKMFYICIYYVNYCIKRIIIEKMRENNFVRSTYILLRSNLNGIRNNNIKINISFVRSKF